VEESGEEGNGATTNQGRQRVNKGRTGARKKVTGSLKTPRGLKKERHLRGKGKKKRGVDAWGKKQKVRRENTMRLMGKKIVSIKNG